MIVKPAVFVTRNLVLMLMLLIIGVSQNKLGAQVIENPTGCKVFDEEDNDYAFAVLISEVRSGEIETITALVDRCPHLLTMTTERGETPLMIAAMRYNLPILTYLVEKGSPLNHLDNNQEHVLIYLYRGYVNTANATLEAFQLLLAQPSLAVNGHGRYHVLVDGIYVTKMPLFFKVVLDDNPALLALFMAHPNFDINQLTQEGKLGVLWMAIFAGNGPLFEYLVNQPALEINYKSQAGQFAVNYALKLGRQSMVAYLVLMRPDLAINVKDQDGDTPLILSVRRGLLDITYQFVRRFSRINVNETDRWGNSFVFYLLASANVEIIQRLLRLRPDIKLVRQNIRGENPLHHCARNFPAVFEFCLAQLAQLTLSVDDQGNSILHHAIAVKNDKVIQFILQAPFADDLINLKNNLQQSPLSQALAAKDYDLATILVAHPAINVETKNQEGNSAAMQLIGPLISREAGVKTLWNKIVYHPLFQINSRNNQGMSLLILMAYHAYLKPAAEFYFTLLSLPARQTNLQDNQGNTALHYLLRFYHDVALVPVIADLLQDPQGEIGLQNNEGQTPLMVFVSNVKQDEAVLAILQPQGNRLNINVQDKNNYTTLIWAAWHCLPNVTKMLLTYPDIALNIKGVRAMTAYEMAKYVRGQRNRSRNCKENYRLLRQVDR